MTETIGHYDIEEIIHFAAKTIVPDSVADPLGYYLAKTAKARTLLQSAGTLSASSSPPQLPSMAIPSAIR
jgi:UDP-glucose 4-epimerase